MLRDQLPALLKLLDDPSPAVRAKVRRALRDFGPELPREVVALGIELDAARQEALDDVVRATLTRTPAAFGVLWRQWRVARDDYFVLESALDHLSRVQLEWEGDTRADEGRALRDSLDELAEEFRAAGEENHPVALAEWLFETRGLRGAPAEHYYFPLNGNLIHVLESGEGLPISLAIIFMLVGRRVHLAIHGCAFPGHFLARAGEVYFDCYNGGRMISPSEAIAITRAAPDGARPAPVATIVARVLANFANAYQFTGERDKVQRTLLYLEQLRAQEPAL